jgi:pyroglutamyl-peptidase
MTRAPVVLLTGFDPFGGDTVNPSWEAVRRLHGDTVHGHRIEAVQLPTAFGRGAAALLDALDRHRPALALCTGLAGHRDALSLERVSVNLIDARIPDNDGAQPIDVPCIAGAPEAYFTTLPVKAALRALEQADIAAELSLSAGTFVCNHVFHVLMHALAGDPARPRGGFVHVPPLPGMPLRSPQARPMSAEAVADGLRLIVDVALRTHDDAHYAAGTLD